MQATIEKDFEENVLPTKEEILMNEDDILKGLFEAAEFKADEQYQKKIQIKRGGRVLFEFRIRPISEEEVGECRRKATRYAPNPAGKNFPRIEVETDFVKLRSYKILAATIPEDVPKVWGNKLLKNKLNLLQDIDVVDAVLLAGEKDWISDAIDEISGYGVTREEYAKN